MNKEILNKIRSCKALQGKTIADICEMQKFRDNLGAYISAQRSDRKAIRASYEAMKKLGGAKGYKLPAHPIDKVMALSVAEFADEYLAVVLKISERNAAERLYIKQLGQQAYNLTVSQMVCDEFPELKDTLIPTSKTN